MLKLPPIGPGEPTTPWPRRPACASAASHSHPAPCGPSILRGPRSRSKSPPQRSAQARDLGAGNQQNAAAMPSKIHNGREKVPAECGDPIGAGVRENVHFPKLLAWREASGSSAGPGFLMAIEGRLQTGHSCSLLPPAARRSHQVEQSCFGARENAGVHHRDRQPHIRTSQARCQ